jgi:hypothetical protein
MHKQPNQRLITIYPSCHQFIKAFAAEDFVFFDKTKCQLKVIDDSFFNVANSGRITWLIQKNPQNGQTITLSSDSVNPNLCPVICTLRLVFREGRLKQPDSMPLGCYRIKKTPMLYMMADKMASLFQVAGHALPWDKYQGLEQVLHSLALSLGMHPSG